MSSKVENRIFSKRKYSNKENSRADNNGSLHTARLSQGNTKSSLLLVPKVINVESKLPQTSRMKFEKSEGGNYRK